MSNSSHRGLRQLLAASWIGALAGTGCTIAQAADLSGKEVVEKTCIECHRTGKDGAPRVGNPADWSSRAKFGLPRLLESSMDGLRKMPSHGGEAGYSDLEMTRAIAYMLSGGKTPDPQKPFAAVSHGSGEQIFTGACSKCHREGKEGAPKVGDWAAWEPRVEKGIDALASSATHGHNRMPARGGFASLSDVDIRAAIFYMVIRSANASR